MVTKSIWAPDMLSNQAKKMKITYIANVRIPTEKAHGLQIIKMCETLSKSGKEVVLVVPHRRNDIEESPFCFYNVKNTFQIVTLPCLDLVSWGRVGYICQSALFAILSVFYVFRKKTDLIYSRHSLPLFFCSFFLKIPFFYEVHVSRYNFSIRWVVKKCASLIVISNGLKKLMIDRGVSPEKIVVAPSGVEIKNFNIGLSLDEAKKKVNLPKNKFVFGYFGSFKTMGYEKGLRVVFDSLKKIKKPIIFVALGGGFQDVKIYKKIAEEMGVSDRVILGGRVDTSKLAIFQAACDVLVMPFPQEVHYTNYMSPVKMFEYMASRRPIVASDLSSIREVLSGDSCFFVKPGSSTDLAEVIDFVLSNTEKAEQKTSLAFEKVSDYTWEKRVDKIFRF